MSNPALILPKLNGSGVLTKIYLNRNRNRTETETDVCGVLTKIYLNRNRNRNIQTPERLVAKVPAQQTHLKQIVNDKLFGLSMHPEVCLFCIPYCSRYEYPWI